MPNIIEKPLTDIVAAALINDLIAAIESGQSTNDIIARLPPRSRLEFGVTADVEGGKRHLWITIEDGKVTARPRQPGDAPEIAH